MATTTAQPIGARKSRASQRARKTSTMTRKNLATLFWRRLCRRANVGSALSSSPLNLRPVDCADIGTSLIRNGKPGPDGRFFRSQCRHCASTRERYLAYSNSGLAFKASFVAPGKTSLPSTSLNLETETATSCFCFGRNRCPSTGRNLGVTLENSLGSATENPLAAPVTDSLKPRSCQLHQVRHQHVDNCGRSPRLRWPGA